MKTNNFFLSLNSPLSPHEMKPPPPKKKTSMEHFAIILFRGEGVTMDEKGVFIQIQNTIVSSKALVLVNNCLNTFVHDCCILYRSKHKCFDYTNKGPLDKSEISMKNILKLQSVQNFATRIITSTRKYDHIQPILRDLN